MLAFRDLGVILLYTMVRYNRARIRLVIFLFNKNSVSQPFLVLILKPKHLHGPALGSVQASSPITPPPFTDG